jgi:hypothetical protein
MCGDLEPEDRLESDLYQRLVVHAHAALRVPASSGDMNAYLDGLFKSVLRQCLAQAEQEIAGNAYRTMSMQSLVLARLAGFLAGHVALNEDPLRKLLEATMLGYQEADMKHLGADPGHDHDHDHHEHDHEHGHHHHHGGH